MVCAVGFQPSWEVKVGMNGQELGLEGLMSIRTLPLHGESYRTTTWSKRSKRQAKSLMMVVDPLRQASEFGSRSTPIYGIITRLLCAGCGETNFGPD